MVYTVVDEKQTELSLILAHEALRMKRGTSGNEARKINSITTAEITQY
jgi:hypothetical protein|tara:strand:+ start:441 stop:584 length:144 start_codon:yes stop_codon:yes gene_type:complete